MEIFNEFPRILDRLGGSGKNALLQVTLASGLDLTRHIGNWKLIPCGAKTNVSFTSITGGAEIKTKGYKYTLSLGSFVGVLQGRQEPSLIAVQQN